MKLTLITLAALLLGALSYSGNALAQAETDPQAEAAAAIQQSETARKDAVREAMSFSPEEAQAFWPIYAEYRTEMRALQAREVELAFEMVEVFPDVANEQADKLLDEWLAINQSRNQVKGQYIPRFRDILEPRRAVRFIQMDNKLDAIVAFDAAQNLPLVR